MLKVLQASREGVCRPDRVRVELDTVSNRLRKRGKFGTYVRALPGWVFPVVDTTAGVPGDPRSITMLLRKLSATDSGSQFPRSDGWFHRRNLVKREADGKMESNRCCPMLFRESMLASWDNGFAGNKRIADVYALE